jgi:HSP20 family protein
MSLKLVADETSYPSQTVWPDEEGQLAIDVYQTSNELIIKAPIAGVKHEELEVSITDELLVIRGERREGVPDELEGYIVQECYWGSFSRSFQFPIAVDSEKASASLVNGILTITVPKAARIKTRNLPVSLG